MTLSRNCLLIVLGVIALIATGVIIGQERSRSRKLKSAIETLESELREQRDITASQQATISSLKDRFKRAEQGKRRWGKGSLLNLDGRERTRESTRWPGSSEGGTECLGEVGGLGVG